VPSPAVAILDVNETLSDLTPLGDRFAEVGASPDLLPTWFAATLRDGISLAAAGAYADFQDVARAALRSQLAGVSDLRRQLEDAAEYVLEGVAKLSPHPDVAPGLRRLRERGIRAATLTNSSVAMAAGLLERAGLAELVERNLSVSEVGRWKPAPETYRYACATLGVAEQDAVMIAVHPWDVDGAQRAGLRGAWLDRHGHPWPEVFTAPAVTAGSLPELADAVAGDYQGALET
jgi:2-haloacid dehalogenase